MWNNTHCASIAEIQYPQTPNLSRPVTVALTMLIPSLTFAESCSKSIDLIIGMERETRSRRMNAARRRRGVRKLTNMVRRKREALEEHGV